MPSTLLLGQKLMPGEFLTSKSAQFQLIYQGDGNLVVYDITINPHPALWSSRTQGHVPGFVLLQADGNLVIYNVAQQGIWSTGTWLPTRKGTSLVLQDDGNLVLYGIAPLFTSFNDIGSLISPGPTPAAPAPAHGDGNGVDVLSVVEKAAQVIEIVVGLFG